MRLLHALSSAVLLLEACWTAAQHCVPSGCSSRTMDYGYLPADTSGDYLYLGGIFDVHEPGDSAYECGGINRAGLEEMEAFLWTTRHFRETYNILQDISVGALGFDSCGRPERALQQLLNLENCAVTYGDAVEPRLVLGYVGPSNSDVAEQIADVTSGFKKTAVSHGASSPTFVHISDHAYFLRIVPSDLQQADILVDSLVSLHWNYTQLLYTNDSYGIQMRDYLIAKTEHYGICTVFETSLAPDASSIDWVDIVDSLVVNYRTRAVIILAQPTHLRELLSAAETRGARGLFTWMAPMTWGDNTAITSGLEDISEGAYTMSLEDSAPGLDIFQDYIAQLTPEMNEDNPWFKEYWMSIFECNLPGEPTKYAVACDTSTQRLNPDNINPLVPYVIRATFALLYGIERARASQCASVGLCGNFINHANRWDVIQDHVRTLNMSDIAYFHPATGAAIATRYSLLNLRAPSASNCGSSHCYTKVGSYDVASQRLDDPPSLYFYDRDGHRFGDATSTCSAPPCAMCGETTVAPSTARAPVAGRPDTGAMTQSNQVGMRAGIWVMVLLILAALGVLMVLAFEGYLLAQICGSNYLASWRSMWLGQLLLLSILLSYLTLFAFIPTPSVTSCTILRMCVGGCYAMIFSVLLVKLMIVLSSKSYGSLQGIYQVLMFAFAWTLQIVVDIEWLILVPPDVVLDSSRGWICKTDFLSHVKSLTYVMALILITTLMAIKTHGIFTNFREGVFIGLTAGFTIPIFIAWVLLGALNPNPDYQDPAMAYGLFLTATLVLLIMFLPKVRQLNSMGVEGNYTEDDRASAIAASIGGLGSVMDAGSVIGSGLNGSIMYGAPSLQRRPKPAPHANGGPMYDSAQTFSSLVNDPKYRFDQHTIQTVRHGNINSLHLRHPGVPASGSVRSMPVSSHLRRMEQNPYGTTSRILKVTGELSGRSYASVGLREQKAHAPIPTFGTTRSNRSSAEKANAITDLGSL